MSLNDTHSFGTQPGLLLRFLLFSLLSLSIMVADYRSDILQPIKTGLSIATYPLQLAVDFPQKASKSVIDFFASHHSLTSENDNFRKQIEFYAAQHQFYQGIKTENENLRKQLSGKTRINHEFSMADILNISSGNFRHESIINAGTDQNLYVGQPVLTRGYIYGQVVAVTPYTSTVIQLTDPKHSIPVRNTRNGIRALAVGTGKRNSLELQDVIANEDVRKGDVYVSSGLGQLFPSDYPVAEVIDVKYTPGDPFITVKAKTFANYDTAREVLLIKNDQEKQQQTCSSDTNDESSEDAE